jgi:outer membrane receptor protein involved in Fe transport
MYLKHLSASLLALAFSLFFLTSAYGQNSVRGIVQDAKNQGLPAATALLLQARDSSLVKGQICTEQGVFLFNNVAPGEYLVGINMLGYASVFSKKFSVADDGAVTDLGSLVLTENTTTLSEAVVSAKRPFLEQKVDRTVVNVANSITNAGGNALEVLQRSPGVQVNRLTRSIALVGKEGVVVMINGKISRQPTDAVVQMLEGMNADNIDRIELIHTPPANFEAEGNAGIIHIVLKTSGEEGLNGGWSASGGYGRGEKYGASGYFNYRKKRLNWFGNYEYNFNLNPQVFTNYRGVMQGADLVETESYSRRPYTPTGTQNARLGLDFQASKKTVVGVLATFFDRNWYMEAENDITYRRNGALESRLLMPNSETNHSRSLAANLNLTHQFSASHSLNFDADLIRFDINNPSHYDLLNVDAAGLRTPLYQLRIGKTTPINIAVAKADYTADFGKKGRLETGLKLTSMGFDNDVQVDSLPLNQDWTVLSRFTSVAELDESVVGAFASYSVKIGPKTDVKAGLRYEHTDTHLGTVEQPDIVKRRYGSWFPSVFLSRELTEHQSLNLSYSRRIGRPQIQHLAPWLIFADPTTTQGGNPAVQPSFTDAVQLAYKFKSWHLSLSHSVEQGAIRYIPTVNTVTNRQENLPKNVDSERVSSANLSFPLHPAKWWELRSNLSANWMETRLTLEGQQVRVSNLFSSVNLVNTLTLRKGFSLEITGFYNSPGYWGIMRWRANGSLDVGIQKDFGEKWGKLRLSGQDLLFTTNWYGSTRQPAANLMVDASYQMAERPFLLSWTNTFGNGKLKASRQRQTGAAEEMRRL